MTDEPSTTSESRARRAANLFDLRRVIGGLFVVYGLLLSILGLFDSDADIEKAAGVNINLYGGLVMLAFGLFMLVWAFTRPLGDELAEDDASHEGGGGAGPDRNSSRRRGDAGRE